MTSGGQLHCVMQARATVKQYEMLRAAALGTALPPEARCGLTILLHRGMWAWARTILLGATRQPSVSTVSMVGLPIADETSERRNVIHLLAAMAMAICERRTA